MSICNRKNRHEAPCLFDRVLHNSDDLT